MSEDLECLFYKVIDYLDGKESDCRKSIPNVEENSKKADVFGRNVIPLGVSNRHIHLSQEHAVALFGQDYVFHKLKDLSQKGQCAYQECVTLVGPKGIIEKVRILGPCRSNTQIELLKSDCFKLGINAPLRLSGDIVDTPGCIVIGPKGAVQIERGCIVAKRHIHMNPSDAKYFGVEDGQVVSLELPGERGGILNQVVVRVSDSFTLECHLDTEEANALGVTGNNKLRLIK
ncbi:phosphate propanoyltransferase [Streptococcus suis]|uniref:phosphate propanoyltransferase n=1 Tax=Streptococcus suis TaxID=1307 RepID=UPI0004209242|nr:phosphate propanoyltransferase [Streptococcus suis]NQK41452.1 phosphate propanoyltransferase [Streptococcus suis]HEL1551347.1 phosphate propanoyltransferase [Streptococcus suis]HEL2320931.1 phosphate propanoyltransferase [Streptococcus suis]HEM2831332.1 phosphate propanoyltransferase [Streptococcus suis]HEM3179181.1 phosphate propanoyltransferase [Streptococcus suis 92-4172]